MPRDRGSSMGADTPGWAAPARGLGVEELLQQILGLTAERSRIAEEEATQAQQQVQQAEQAPVEQDNPLVNSIATAGSRVATTLAGPGGPNYSKQLSDEAATKDAAATKARTDNVTRLRATYEKAAERALKAGDGEAEVKARVALKKIDEQVAKDKAASDEIRWRAQQDYKAGIDDKQATTKFGRDMQLEGVKQQGRKELKAGADGRYSKIADEHVPVVGQQLVDGTLTWGKIGQGDVGKMAKWIEDSGQVVLNNKGRENSKKLDGFEEAIKVIESLSSRVNTAKGSARFGQGAQNAAEGFLRNTPRGIAANQLEQARKQFLALVARGYGEVGNLAEQEQVRQLEGLPSQWDDIESAQLSLARAKEIIGNLRKDNLKTYTEPMGGASFGVTGGSSSIIKWGEDAAGNPVRLP